LIKRWFELLAQLIGTHALTLAFTVAQLIIILTIINKSNNDSLSSDTLHPRSLNVQVQKGGGAYLASI
jgi:hypothetical protein